MGHKLYSEMFCFVFFLEFWLLSHIILIIFLHFYGFSNCTSIILVFRVLIRVMHSTKKVHSFCWHLIFQEKYLCFEVVDSLFWLMNPILVIFFFFIDKVCNFQNSILKIMVKIFHLKHFIIWYINRIYLFVLCRF